MKSAPLIASLNVNNYNKFKTNIHNTGIVCINLIFETDYALAYHQPINDPTEAQSSIWIGM
jgi:hypothetical protein